MRVCQFRHFGIDDAPDQPPALATGNTYLFYGVWRMCQTDSQETKIAKIAEIGKKNLTAD
jgi:hypothetical protein